jgi:hypothetical protein
MVPPWAIDGYEGYVNERARIITATTGAFGLGGFAAALGLCCTVPWAVAILGVTGAVAFARLAFLLPYSVVGAAGLLALAFWWVYRTPAECNDATCVPRNRQKLRWFVWISAVVVAALSIVALTMQVTLA